MVEWIEITTSNPSTMTVIVSTLVVEWIEIGTGAAASAEDLSLHPRGHSTNVSTLVVEWIEIPG